MTAQLITIYNAIVITSELLSLLPKTDIVEEIDDHMMITANSLLAVINQECYDAETIDDTIDFLKIMTRDTIGRIENYKESLKRKDYK